MKKQRKTRTPGYNPAIHPILARVLAEKGKTDKEIFITLDVSKETYYKWQRLHPAFKTAVQEGKIDVDKDIEQSLFSRAKGMIMTEKKVVQNPDGTVRQEITEKQIPPDTAAAFIWLKNRKPKEWRDKHDVEHSGKDGGGIEIILIDPSKQE